MLAIHRLADAMEEMPVDVLRLASKVSGRAVDVVREFRHARHRRARHRELFGVGERTQSEAPTQPRPSPARDPPAGGRRLRRRRRRSRVPPPRAPRSRTPPRASRRRLRPPLDLIGKFGMDDHGLIPSPRSPSERPASSPPPRARPPRRRRTTNKRPGIPPPRRTTTRAEDERRWRDPR